MQCYTSYKHKGTHNTCTDSEVIGHWTWGPFCGRDDYRYFCGVPDNIASEQITLARALARAKLMDKYEVDELTR